MIIVLLALLPLPTATAQAQVIVASPLFSVKHGLFTDPLQLELTTATAGATIRYTLDATRPTTATGTVYIAPIVIDQTTIVRAIAYTADANYSATVTQSYLFPADVKMQPPDPGGGWPDVFAKDDGSGPYPADYEMDPEVVNHSNYGNGTFENALRVLPSVSIVTEPENLWDPATGIYYNQQMSGSAWERAASLEWLDPNDGPDFTENAGFRIHGGASRIPFRTPKKSFRFYFKAAYGKSKLDFKLFADDDATSKFDRIVLRAGHNDSWPALGLHERLQASYFDDQLARDVYHDMGHLSPHGNFVHLYLNGLYWGLYNITEHINEKYLADYIGADETDFDLIDVDLDEDPPINAEAGDLVQWNELQAQLNVANVSDALYQEVQQRLDVVNLADYMILQHYLGNIDWPHNNWSAWRLRTGADTRFRILVWDTEATFTDVNIDVTHADAPATPARLFLQLMTNAEFQQVVNDRFWLHLGKNNGLLTSMHCQQRVTQLAAVIDQAIIGESARWGDYARDLYPPPTLAMPGALPAYLYSRDLPHDYTDPLNQTDDTIQSTWLDLLNSKLSLYCPNRPGILAAQYSANSWLASGLLPPTFAQDGGAVAANFVLTIDNTPNAGAGNIYYTTNGADPRAVGGALADEAMNGADEVSIVINQVTTIKARVYDGNQWSPLYEATFYPPQPWDDLVINEIHYAPTAVAPADAAAFQFIELFNKGATGLRLDNVKFTRGFAFQFPHNTILNPGAYLVLAADSATFLLRYQLAANGQMRGHLADGGEAIELRDAVGNVIDIVDYRDRAPWPVAPVGCGFSLSLIDPTLDNAQPASWAVSTTMHGTPGQANGLTMTNPPPSTNPTGSHQLFFPLISDYFCR
ncbi:MAG: CotH kinase family protein [Caldilineaceae bacterium]